MSVEEQEAQAKAGCSIRVSLSQARQVMRTDAISMTPAWTWTGADAFFQDAVVVLQHVRHNAVHAADEHGHGLDRSEFFFFPHFQDVLDQSGGDGSLVH